MKSLLTFRRLVLFHVLTSHYYSSLIEEGGDWDRRNRLKVYKGYYAIIIRDFKTAASNFLESISTFTSYELMPYKTFVEYTVLVAIVALKRAELGKKVSVENLSLTCNYRLFIFYLLLAKFESILGDSPIYLMFSAFFKFEF